MTPPITAPSVAQLFLPSADSRQDYTAPLQQSPFHPCRTCENQQVSAVPGPLLDLQPVAQAVMKLQLLPLNQ